MKRLLHFDYQDEKYILIENDDIIFAIDGKALKFVSLDFYNGLYKGKNKSTAIVLDNIVCSDDKEIKRKSAYIYSWLYEIIESIQKEIQDPEDMQDDLENTLIQFPVRTIPYYDMAACAGTGFYFDQEEYPEKEIQTRNQNADFALTVSGKSMEPTILDRSIVLVQKVDILKSNDIGIFVVNGELMCKRYITQGDKTILSPDNNTDFPEINITEDMICSIQGKVIDYNYSPIDLET